MKKVLILIGLLLLISTQAYAIVTADTVFSAKTAAGVSAALGGDRVYNSLGCVITGTAGTMNVDIDISVDGTNFYGAVDDVAALGYQSFTDKPFTHYQVDIDTCTACTLTIKCVPHGGMQ